MPPRSLALVAAGLLAGFPSPVRAEARGFETGSLIIPMDLEYQDEGMLQAYGLVFQLLRQGVKVHWVISPTKTWHAKPCDTAGDECAWDCAEEGSKVKCAYPTASPDFYAAAKVLWDGDGEHPAGTAIAQHGYRGGPFVVAAADAAKAKTIVEAWNDKAKWTASPWAKRTVFKVVTVHEATAPFTGHVRKQMVAAPTIAVFSDGNEKIATGYLRAAGIPQSSGAEFPSDNCAQGTCGAGTANPDMLTVPSVAGDMGTCDAPNADHRNGQLFKNGVPAFCQIMSMHWNVADRETVECNGGACPASPADCAGKPITYHGHEVVAEVRSFLEFPVHFFAECQAVNAYENTVPNPAWPYLDDPGRQGHFLTTTGTPPDCVSGGCSDGDFGCVVKGCDNGARDCCLPKDLKEKGAGFLIAQQPSSNALKILRPDVPYNQLDGEFATVGGSEPAYNLSTYLGTAYKNAREVTFITGAAGPGVQDVWMTGYVDGVCDIGTGQVNLVPRDGAACTRGKVSYLGGHSYSVSTPISNSPSTQGTRLFLNALFEADCVTSDGQPVLGVSLAGDGSLAEASPQGTYVVGFANTGKGTALDGVLSLELPAGVTVVDSGGGTLGGATLSFAIGSIGNGTNGSPAATGSRTVKLAFPGKGAYLLGARLAYRVGATSLIAGPVSLGVGVGQAAPIVAADAGTTSTGPDGGAGANLGLGEASGCGCQTASLPLGAGLLVGLVGMVLRRRRAR